MGYRENAKEHAGQAYADLKVFEVQQPRERLDCILKALGSITLIGAGALNLGREVVKDVTSRTDGILEGAGGMLLLHTIYKIIDNARSHNRLSNEEDKRSWDSKVAEALPEVSDRTSLFGYQEMVNALEKIDLERQQLKFSNEPITEDCMNRVSYIREFLLEINNETLPHPDSPRIIYVLKGIARNLLLAHRTSSPSSLTRDTKKAGQVFEQKLSIADEFFPIQVTGEDEAGPKNWKDYILTLDPETSRTIEAHG